MESGISPSSYATPVLIPSFFVFQGFNALVVSLALLLALLLSGVLPPSYLHAHFLPLASAAILFSFVLAVLLYARALTRPRSDLAPGGQTGSGVYDFFIGRELNPRLGPLDLKFFCELRPGLIGWVVLDLCFLAEGVERAGGWAGVWAGGKGEGLAPLVLVVAFHVLYVADALWHEVSFSGLINEAT